MTDTLEKTRKLLIADRCDRCGSQAFVLVRMIAGELYFCGHHYQKNQKILDKSAFEIIDERWAINEKSNSSA
jgi:hypothetical protein